MSEELLELVMSRRVIVTVGAGGVGKTTTAAALGVAAARRGRRVLCLTIDPARRLAESLGLGHMTTEAQEVDRGLFEKAGLRIEGRLTAMMLDTKKTFDDLVLKYSSSPEKARTLLENRLYRYVSTSLAGTQEYMAMEKLVAVREDEQYDLIVLDTPPTANALDFLDAPKRLVDALDSSTMRWLASAIQASGKLSLNVLAKSAATVLRGIGRITGGGFLEEMAQFIAELDDLFGGFRQRALAVQSALRGRDVSFVLVTSPAPMSIYEVLYFSERLAEAAMPRGAFVVNRVHVPPPSLATTDIEAIGREVETMGIRLEEGAGERLLQAHEDANRLAALDSHHLRHLESAARLAEPPVPVVHVPELPTDVHDLAHLSLVADRLVGAIGNPPAL